MDKQSEYMKIVDEVNRCMLCDGFTAISRNKSKQVILEHFPIKHVNLWSYWQGNLSPEILVIGQDWGSLPNSQSIAIFTNSDAYRAKIVPGKNPTDNNLVRLFQEVFAVNILEDQRLFFTNSVFCYKKGNLSENVRKTWFDNCNSRFMSKLITILEPRCIVTLGKYALDGLTKCGNVQYSDNSPVKRNVSLATIVQNQNQLWWSSFDAKLRVRLFPVFHTGGYSNRNRPFQEQVNDWERIRPFVDL